MVIFYDSKFTENKQSISISTKAVPFVFAIAMRIARTKASRWCELIFSFWQTNSGDMTVRFGDVNMELHGNIHTDNYNTKWSQTAATNLQLRHRHVTPPVTSMRHLQSRCQRSVSVFRSILAANEQAPAPLHHRRSNRKDLRKHQNIQNLIKASRG